VVSSNAALAIRQKLNERLLNRLWPPR